MLAVDPIILNETHSEKVYLEPQPLTSSGSQLGAIEPAPSSTTTVIMIIVVIVQLGLGCIQLPELEPLDQLRLTRQLMGLRRDRDQ